MPIYIKHDFIAKSQSHHLTFIKDNLEEGEFLVTLDFAENYTFKIQDAVQSYHWSNDQATIHPYVIYHRTEYSIESDCFVIISEETKHNTAAVHLFNKKMIRHLKEIFGDNIKKLIFFSDGCAAQYKNKHNFTNMLYYHSDFNVKAEWHFFATSHGKGACDGVGGTVKRLASRASLQRPAEKQITTPFKLFEWAQESCDNIYFEFCSKKEHEKEEVELQNRFQKAKTIKGTRKYHFFKPMGNKYIYCKEFSSCDDFVLHKLV